MESSVSLREVRRHLRSLAPKEAKHFSFEVMNEMHRYTAHKDALGNSWDRYVAKLPQITHVTHPQKSTLKSLHHDVFMGLAYYPGPFKEYDEDLWLFYKCNPDKPDWETHWKAYLQYMKKEDI